MGGEFLCVNLSNSIEAAVFVLGEEVLLADFICSVNTDATGEGPLGVPSGTNVVLVGGEAWSE